MRGSADLIASISAGSSLPVTGRFDAVHGAEIIAAPRQQGLGLDHLRLGAAAARLLHPGQNELEMVEEILGHAAVRRQPGVALVRAHRRLGLGRQPAVGNARVVAVQIELALGGADIGGKDLVRHPGPAGGGRGFRPRGPGQQQRGRSDNDRNPFPHRRLP